MSRTLKKSMLLRLSPSPQHSQLSNIPNNTIKASNLLTLKYLVVID